MPRLNLIILAQPPSSAPPRTQYNVAFWADVPSDKQSFYAAQNAKYTSQWLGATSTDNTNFQNGSMVEQVITFNADSTLTITVMGAELVSMQAAYQAAINAYNPWNYYGTTYVSTATPAWTIATVA